MCPAMEFTEESKPNMQASVTTLVASNSLSKPLKPSPSSPPSANSSPPSPRGHGHDHVTNQENIDGDDDNYFNNFPSGYRFCPHDHELVLYYLKNKVCGLPLPRNRIVDVTLYQHNPEELAVDLVSEYKIYKKTEKPVKNQEQHSTRRYQLRFGPNDVAATDADCNSGTDSWENPRQQQNITPLAGFADAAYFRNGYSAAQVPILSATYEDTVPLLLSSDFPKGLQEESWNHPTSHFDLADTFCLYDSMEDRLEAINSFSNNHPAVNLHINPSASSTNSASSGLSTSAKTVPQHLPKWF
ncbi:unnamed protein product [Dovyalis caffra]|uniref:NAC domain-containing protein n=1 Tax=Dovyalis caffra TaxID=77055 RepID=A0AAV1RAW3_9ROSI|nr:unnamed protein product [Dovyalis caffra]